MAPNSERPHVLVLPEDDANRQIANGFHLGVDWNKQRRMQVLAVAGGWTEVLNQFRSEHVSLMRSCAPRLMLLLIDLDGHRERLAEARATVPPDLNNRVFVLGTLTRPEGLKPQLGSYEEIGSAIADDCRDGTGKIWQHELLEPNALEVERLRQPLRSILFASEP